MVRACRTLLDQLWARHPLKPQSLKLCLYSWASQSSTTAAVQDWSSDPKGSPVKGS